MKIYNLSLLLVMMVLVCVGCATAPWQQWREDIEAELNEGSLLADTPRGQIEYAIRGSGPVILALHGSMGGYDSGLAIGQMLIQAVTESSNTRVSEITLLSVSRPGYLRTPLEVGASTAEQADAMADLLDFLGIDRVAVAGGSAGGPVALQFALRHPDRCWGMILLCSVFEQKDITDFSPFERWYLSTAFSDRNSYRTLIRMERKPEKVLAGMHPATAKRLQEDPRLMEMATLLMRTSFPMTLREKGTYNDMRKERSFSWELLSEICVPTIIMHGTDDEWAPVEIARRAAEEIPDAQYVEFEGADHLFFITHSERFGNVIALFIEENYPQNKYLEKTPS